VEAHQLLESQLLGQLVDAYRYSVFEQWQQELDKDKRNDLFAKMYMTNDLTHWIENKCKELIDGTTSNS